jgi:hypothetical protein
MCILSVLGACQGLNFFCFKAYRRRETLFLSLGVCLEIDPARQHLRDIAMLVRLMAQREHGDTSADTPLREGVK